MRYSLRYVRAIYSDSIGICMLNLYIGNNKEYYSKVYIKYVNSQYICKCVCVCTCFFFCSVRKLREQQ